MLDFKRIGLLLVGLMTGYLLHVIDGANLVINPSGNKLSKPAGKGFGLTCQGEGGPSELFTEMKWKGPKGELHEGSTGSIEVAKATSALLLTFKSPSSEDGGMYNCTARFDSMDPLNASVELVFYHDITWEDCPNEQALVINNRGKIKCRVSANPPASITWLKDNIALDVIPSKERYVTETDGVTVTDVTDDDKGSFSVKAMVSQTGRFEGRSINVEVHHPPEIIELQDKAVATEGSEKILSCQASGFPRPVYSWFDPQQRNLSTLEGHTVDHDTGTLVIDKVKREDRGTYTCMAKNPAGDTKRSLDLTVIVKPEIKEFSNITSVENKAATFECQAEGEPLPEVTIRKGQEKIITEDDDRITLSKRIEAQRSILTLTIMRTMRSDDGLYYCAAENKGGNAERVGHLTVEFAPVMTSTPSTSVKTWKGNPVNLTCIAEAIPNATISWTVQGKDIRDDEYYTVYGRSSHSNLLVRPPISNQGDPRNVYEVYRCDASNKHGPQHINIELKEARKPFDILETTLSKATATTLTFKFHGPTNDGGLPIHAYVAEFREEDAEYEEPYEVQEWSEGTPYVLEKLKPRTAYIFRFAAKNDVGIGDWSEGKRILMPAEAAPEPPKFTTPGGNVSTYPDHFEVRWTVPLDNGKEIDYFELRYFEVTKTDNVWRLSGESITQKIRDWENAPLYVMQNLKPNTYYKVEVRAHNEIGFSQDATMVFQTAAGTADSSGYEASGGHGSALSTSAIAAIIIVLVLVILIVLDATCYVRYQWGLMYLVRTKVCAKPMTNDKAKEAAVEDGKGGGNDDPANNGNVKTEAIDGAAPDKGIENFDKKSRTEVDNPAFDSEKEPLKSAEETEHMEVAAEDTPMIHSPGAKDTKTNDGNVDDMKNKSPKGSKSSIAKDSLV